MGKPRKAVRLETNLSLFLARVFLKRERFIGIHYYFFLGERFLEFPSKLLNSFVYFWTYGNEMKLLLLYWLPKTSV